MRWLFIFFIRELEKALLSRSECWIHPRHAESLGEDRIPPGKNRQAACDPTTCHLRKADAGREDELKNMTQRLLPVAVSGTLFNIRQSQPGRLGGGVDQQRRGLQDG